MFDYQNFFSWILSLPSNSPFLPKISFSKRSQSFTLYFYVSPDSYISRFRFDYDGGSLLPSFTKDSFPDIISRFFSFNLSSLKKAIHKRKGAVILYPKVAAINKHFFDVKQSRSPKSNSSSSSSYIPPQALDIARSAAYSFDFNLFPDFKSFFPNLSDKKTFSLFKKLVLDFQSNLC